MELIKKGCIYSNLKLLIFIKNIVDLVRSSIYYVL